MDYVQVDADGNCYIEHPAVVSVVPRNQSVVKRPSLVLPPKPVASVPKAKPKARPRYVRIDLPCPPIVTLTRDPIPPATYAEPLPPVPTDTPVALVPPVAVVREPEPQPCECFAPTPIVYFPPFGGGGFWTPTIVVTNVTPIDEPGVALLFSVGILALIRKARRVQTQATDDQAKA